MTEAESTVYVTDRSILREQIAEAIEPKVNEIRYHCLTGDNSGETQIADAAMSVVDRLLEWGHGYERQWMQARSTAGNLRKLLGAAEEKLRSVAPPPTSDSGQYLTAVTEQGACTCAEAGTCSSEDDEPTHCDLCVHLDPEWPCPGLDEDADYPEVPAQDLKAELAAAIHGAFGTTFGRCDLGHGLGEAGAVADAILAAGWRPPVDALGQAPAAVLPTPSELQVAPSLGVGEPPACVECVAEVAAGRHLPGCETYVRALAKAHGYPTAPAPDSLGGS